MPAISKEWCLRRCKDKANKWRLRSSDNMPKYTVLEYRQRNITKPWKCVSRTIFFLKRNGNNELLLPSTKPNSMEFNYRKGTMQNVLIRLLNNRDSFYHFTRTRTQSRSVRHCTLRSMVIDTSHSFVTSSSPMPSFLRLNNCHTDQPETEVQVES